MNNQQGEDAGGGVRAEAFGGQEKKRAKRCAKYLTVRDDVLESARASYKAEPEKKRTAECERYQEDPE